MSKPETIIVDDIKYVRADSVRSTYTPRKEGPWEIGQPYFVRTVTMSIHGLLVDVTPTELVFTNASWIADTGRFHNYITGKTEAEEIEPFDPKSAVIVGRGAIVDAVRKDNLPKGQK